MKHAKFFLTLLFSCALIAGTMSIAAEPGPYTGPDGATCTFGFNEEGPFGPVGVYECEGGTDGPYTGYGPPDWAQVE